MLNSRPSFPGAEPIPGQAPINDAEPGNDEGHAAMMGQEVAQPGEGGNLNSFTEEEIANLRSIFEMFDPNKTGAIEVKDLETIMGSL